MYPGDVICVRNVKIIFFIILPVDSFSINFDCKNCKISFLDHITIKIIKCRNVYGAIVIFSYVAIKMFLILSSYVFKMM